MSYSGGSIYNIAEGDQIDLSLLPGISDAYYKNGVPLSSLVQVIEDKSTTFAQLWINPSAFGANVQQFIPIAMLDGFKAGDNVNVILDSAQPDGVNLRTTIAGLIFTDALGDNWNAVVTDQGSGAIVETNWAPIQGANGSVYVPGPNDDLLIDNGHHVTIFGADYNGNVDQASSLTLASGASLDITNRLELGSGTNNNGNALSNDGVVTIDNGAMQVAGNIVNNGQIAIASPNAYLQELDLNGTVTLSGAGAVVLGEIPGGASSINGAHVDVGDTLENYSTIEGAGAIGQTGYSGYALLLHNHGIVDGNNDTLQLVLNQPYASPADGKSGGAIVNDGTIEATGLAGLNIFDSTIINVGPAGQGTLGAFGTGGAANDIPLILGGSYLEGGRLATSGTGVVEFGLGGNGSFTDTLHARVYCRAPAGRAAEPDRGTAQKDDEPGSRASRFWSYSNR